MSRASDKELLERWLELGELILDARFGWADEFSGEILGLADCIGYSDAERFRRLLEETRMRLVRKAETP